MKSTYFCDVNPRGHANTALARSRAPPAIITSDWSPEYVTIARSPSTSDEASEDSNGILDQQQLSAAMLDLPYYRQRSNSTPGPIFDDDGPDAAYAPPPSLSRPDSGTRRRRLPMTPDQLQAQQRNAQLPPHPSWSQRYSPDMNRPASPVYTHDQQRQQHVHDTKHFVSKSRSGGHRKLPLPPSTQSSQQQQQQPFTRFPNALPPPFLGDKGRQQSENLIRSPVIINEPQRPASALSAAYNGQYSRNNVDQRRTSADSRPQKTVPQPVPQDSPRSTPTNAMRPCNDRPVQQAFSPRNSPRSTPTNAMRPCNDRPMQQAFSPRQSPRSTPTNTMRSCDERPVQYQSKPSLHHSPIRQVTSPVAHHTTMGMTDGRSPSDVVRSASPAIELQSPESDSRFVISPERLISSTSPENEEIDRDSYSTPPRGSSMESTSMSLERLTAKSLSDNEIEQSATQNPQQDTERRGSSISQISVADEGGSRCSSVAGIPPSSSWTSTGGEKVDTRLGLAHMAVQYFPVRKRLRVCVLKVEGLGGQLRPDLELHAFAKICLLPGKVQRQQSRIVKRSRDAVFNEEFFFDQVSPTDIEQKTVSMRVCHHVGKQFHKDIIIGEVEVPLNCVDGLQTKKEIKLAYPLKPKLNSKKLGRITVTSCLEMDARRLTINVIKADDLPKYGISGPPDPCVRIIVNQNGREQTKQTRILKNTTSAVYKEAVMFLVSTRPQDLEVMEIRVGVHDTARTAAMDDLIGVAYLGSLAQDKSELDQWKQTLHNSGKEYKATHNLKLPKDK